MHIDLRTASLILAFVGAVSCANQRIEVESIIPSVNVNSAVRTLSSNLNNYRPPASFTPHNAQEVALEFARSQLHVKDGDFIVTTSHKSKISGTTHVYLQQTIKGINVSNGVVGVHVSKANKIIAYDDSFFKSNAAGQSTTNKLMAEPFKTWDGQTAGFVSPADALRTFATHIKQSFDASKVQAVPQPKPTNGGQSYLLKNVGFTKSAVKVSQSYIQTSANEVAPAWKFLVKMPLNEFLVHVSADGTKILALSDLMTFASYDVVKIGNNNPIDTPLQTVTNPADRNASPNGWHTQGDKKFTTTIGNNVFAQVNYNFTDTDNDGVDDSEDNWKNNHRPDGGKNLDFNFPYDAKKDLKHNVDAAVTNLFYVNNFMHDIFYQYGFDEAAGNFQEDNGNKGGKGSDAVAAHVLAGYDSPGYRGNAFFTNSVDGERPTMAMFGFDNIAPGRDGSLENDIISHEYGHGISGRLTGGSANSQCLLNLESRGMNEGWSDFYASWLEMKPTDNSTKNVEMGRYVIGKNIRHFAYSTNQSTNPLNYNYLNDFWWIYEPHSAGEIWATMLYEVYWNFVNKLGFQENKYSVDLTKGNTLFLQIVVDALKLQPCNPTFLQARDAIIQAEQQLTGGKHACEIWRGFAKRGLGYKVVAKTGRKESDNSLPPNCTA